MRRRKDFRLLCCPICTATSLQTGGGIWGGVEQPEVPILGSYAMFNIHGSALGWFRKAGEKSLSMSIIRGGHAVVPYRICQRSGKAV